MLVHKDTKEGQPESLKSVKESTNHGKFATWYSSQRDQKKLHTYLGGRDERDTEEATQERAAELELSSRVDNINLTHNGSGKPRKNKSFDDGTISRTSWRRTCRKKKGFDEKKSDNEKISTEKPSEVAVVNSFRNLLTIVIDNIGEQLGISGTAGCYADSVTHYTISRLAVVFGLS